MGILDFILGIFAILVGAITVLIIMTMIYNSKKLEDENNSLKEQLHKIRKRKMGGKK